jgi:predicted nucleotidyltransferase
MLDHAAAAIRALSPGAEVILFGSRVTGTAREDSDFDFLVVADTDDRYQLMMQLARKLQALEGFPSFDLIVIPRSQWERVRRMRGFVGWEADQHGVRIGA